LVGEYLYLLSYPTISVYSILCNMMYHFWLDVHLVIMTTQKEFYDLLDEQQILS
jgi:hypothetical protein